MLTLMAAPQMTTSGTMAQGGIARKICKVGWCCWHLSHPPIAAPQVTTSGPMAWHRIAREKGKARWGCWPFRTR